MISISVKSSGWPKKEDLEDLAVKQIKDLTGLIFRYAVRFSPVYTGSFRASWRVGLNAARTDVTTAKNPFTPISGAVFEWPASFKLGDSVMISNNQPYAELIEYEHWSKQAPYGVLRVAVNMAMSRVR